MSELVNNLQSIYNIKLQIKDVLDTESDVFSDYPDLIEAAISGGGGSSAEDALTAPTLGECLYNIDEPSTSGDLINISIMSNFASYYQGEPIESARYIVDQIEFDTVAYEVVDNGVETEEIEHPVHVILTQGEGNWDMNILNETYFDSEDYMADIMEEGYFRITCRSWSATEGQAGDDYDWVVECEGLDYINLMENCNPVEEITENGFVPNNGALGFDVNVPSGGMSEGTFNIFNFLVYGLNQGMVEISNKAFEEINLYNLAPVNYPDPMDGTDTKNQYVVMTLWDNSQMDTEVEFVHVQGDATSDGDDHWCQFNELSQSSDADEFMAVHIDVYNWASDIDPDTGMDAGSWEVSDTYVAAFENSYVDESDGNWTYTIRFYYNNSEWVVDLYQNGILVEEGVSAFVQQ